MFSQVGGTKARRNWLGALRLLLHALYLPGTGINAFNLSVPRGFEGRAVHVSG
jgi:hypothetical protein